MMSPAFRIAQTIVALCASLLVAGAVGNCAGRSSMERELRFDRALYAENLAALRDTSRRLLLEVATLGDSLVVTQRRAVQQEQREDALDNALQIERRAKVAALLEIPRVMSTVGGDVVAASDSSAVGADTRRAHFLIEDARYSGSADVVLPRPPGRPELSLDLGMRPIPLELRIGCSAVSGDGVGAASASVTAPKWARLTLTSVEQEAAVCSPVRARVTTHRGLTTALRARVAVVIGYGVMPTNMRPRAVLAAGVRLW